MSLSLAYKVIIDFSKVGAPDHDGYKIFFVERSMLKRLLFLFNGKILIRFSQLERRK